MNNKLAIVRIV